MKPINFPAKIATRTALVALLLAAGCALVPDATEPVNPPRKEVFFAITASNQLISFNAGQPQKLLTRKPVTGLAAAEEIVGVDFRVARGVLYALGRSGSGARLYTIDTANGRATPIGAAALAVTLEGGEFGFDFNPTVDRIRLVSNTGQNLRLHPDSGAAVDANPDLAGLQQDARLTYAKGDANAGRAPAVMSAGYTYNKVNDKITTNYAIDAATGSLVIQGTKEGVNPVVSPNTGLLATVGKLGVGRFERASFDIADTTGAAFLATTAPGARESKFYMVDLDTGTSRFMGTVGGGEAVRGMSFEP